MWTRIDVTWEFVTPLCASTPSDPDLIKAWLEARRPAIKPPDARSIQDVAEEVIGALPDVPAEETKLLVFPRINGVLSARLATMRAHLKDCATVLSSLYVGKIKGERSFAVKVKNALYWPPETEWVPILRKSDGQPFTEPTGTVQRPVHSMTPQGMISAIKVFETVEGAMIRFPLVILTQPSGNLVVTETDLKTLFQYGGTHGYGGERSYDGGRYVFSLAKAAE